MSRLVDFLRADFELLHAQLQELEGVKKPVMHSNFESVILAEREELCVMTDKLSKKYFTILDDEWNRHPSVDFNKLLKDYSGGPFQKYISPFSYFIDEDGEKDENPIEKYTLTSRKID